MERRSSHDEKKSGRMDDVYDERHVRDALFLYAKSMLLRHTMRTANVKAGPDAQRQEDCRKRQRACGSSAEPSFLFERKEKDHERTSVQV